MGIKQLNKLQIEHVYCLNCIYLQLFSKRIKVRTGNTNDIIGSKCKKSKSLLKNPRQYVSGCVKGCPLSLCVPLHLTFVSKINKKSG